MHGITQDITEHTRMVSVPVFVLAGEHGQVEPVGVLRDNLAPCLSRPGFVVVPHTGHLIPLEAPADLVDAVTAFAPAA